LKKYNLKDGLPKPAGAKSAKPNNNQAKPSQEEAK
jgi:hypothetical protein